MRVSSLTDVPTDTVDAVLLKHIIASNVQCSQLVSEEDRTFGGPITVDAMAFTLTEGSGTSNIVTSLLDI